MADADALAPSATDPLAAGFKGQSTIEQAKQQYKILNDPNIVMMEAYREGDPRFLEAWPPGEPGAPGQPRPAQLPLDKYGIELIKRDTRPIDILGDVVSHFLVNNDPKLKAYYERFAKDMSPYQQNILREQYEHEQREYGEDRSYEDWKRQSGLPSYFRGYAFQQWPREDIGELYSDSQRAMFDEMMGYLGGR